MALENLGTDINGRPDFSLDAPIACANVLLTASTPSTITVPVDNNNYNRAFFSFTPGTNVWVTMDGSIPSIPNGTPATNTQELNPSIRKVITGQTLKFISDTASYVNVRFDRGA